MRTIHVIKATGIAGAERHLLILLPLLKQRGLEPELVLLVEPGNPADDLAAAAGTAGIPVHREAIPRDIAYGLVNRLAKHFKRRQPDAVHTHLFHADLYGTLAARRAGVRHILSSRHNDDAFRLKLPYRQMNRWLWSRIEHGIAISEHVRRFSIEVEGAPPDKITTVHYGFDPRTTAKLGKGARQVIRAELGIPPGGMLLGMVSRLAAQKGIRYGIEAFWRISERHPNAHLVIAGDGPLRDDLERQVRGYRLSERVQFLGWRDDALAIIAALDVLLLPSLWEGFGLTLLEAMAVKTPVLASKVSAIPEIVLDGETGLLSPPQDVDHLTSSLLLLLEDVRFRETLAEAAFQRLGSAFNVERMADSTAAVYQALLNRDAAPAYAV